MIIKTLIDDQALDGYAYEHGLSYWISVNGKNILFDLGQSGLFFGECATDGRSYCIG